jgi:hypothetical protein
MGQSWAWWEVLFWLDRREHEKRVTEERERQLKQLHLPTDEEIRIINADRNTEQAPEPMRTLAEAGSVILSMILSSAAVYQVRDPMLGFAFGACIGFLLTRRLTKAFFK